MYCIYFYTLTKNLFCVQLLKKSVRLFDVEEYFGKYCPSKNIAIDIQETAHCFSNFCMKLGYCKNSKVTEWDLKNILFQRIMKEKLPIFALFLGCQPSYQELFIRFSQFMVFWQRLLSSNSSKKSHVVEKLGLLKPHF